MYDLIVKGGTVVDPSQNLHGVNDVAIEDGKIARIASKIPAGEAKRVVEVKGKVVTPGLIDLHTHVYSGVIGTGVDPDIGGGVLVEQGVKEVFCCVTHPVLSRNGPELMAKSNFTEVVVADTIPISPEKQNGKFTVLSVAPLLGEAIYRIHKGLSVGDLFQ